MAVPYLIHTGWIDDDIQFIHWKNTYVFKRIFDRVAMNIICLTFIISQTGSRPPIITAVRIHRSILIITVP
jgi:hypothetical protein